MGAGGWAKSISCPNPPRRRREPLATSRDHQGRPNIDNGARSGQAAEIAATALTPAILSWGWGGRQPPSYRCKLHAHRVLQL